MNRRLAWAFSQGVCQSVLDCGEQTTALTQKPRQTLPGARPSREKPGRERSLGVRRWAIRQIGRLVPTLAVAALVLACFHQLVLHPDHLIVDGNRPSIDDFQKIEPRQVGNDLTQLFLPQTARISAQIAQGRWPSAWDSSGFCGRPRVGNPQAGLYYPPVWGVWLLGKPSGLGWLTVGHLIWAGIGVYALSRRFAVGPFAATVAAGVYAISPYMLAQVFEGHYPHVWGACWFPWAFLAADGLRTGDLRGTLTLPPILAIAALTGHPQEAYYLTITIGVWLLFDAIRMLRRGQGNQALKIMAAWAGVLVLTLGLSAIELIPDAEAAKWGRKADQLTIAEASKYHVDLLNLAQLLSPDALGGPSDFFGHDNYWETVLSIGFVPLFLAVVGRKRARGWMTLAILGVVFAAGWRLGLFAALYELLPGMNRFRVPARSLFLASLAGAMLVGSGLEALGALDVGRWLLDGRRLRRLGIALAVILGTCQIVAWSLKLDDRVREPRPSAWAKADRRPRANAEREIGRWAMAGCRILHAPAAWLAIAGVLGSLAWLQTRPQDRRKIAVGLGLLAWVELGCHGSSLLKTAPVSRFLGPDPVAEAIFQQPPVDPFRIRARDPFYSDLRAEAAGLEKTNLNDAFQIGHAADLYEVLYPVFGPFRAVLDQGQMADVVRQYRSEIRQAVLDRLGVAFLITDRPLADAPWPIQASGIWGHDPYLIYRNPTALPRAYVVPRAVELDQAASPLSALLSVSPRDAVLLSTDPLGFSGARQAFRPAEYQAIDPDHLVISVETDAPGLLVVADTWMPGWSALLNGKPAPILRGNHAQRVVPLLAAGSHRIDMRYEPPGFQTGLFLTAMAATIWVIGLVFSLVRSSRVRRRLGRDPAMPQSWVSTQPSIASGRNEPAQSLRAFPASIAETQRI